MGFGEGWICILYNRTKSWDNYSLSLLRSTYLRHYNRSRTLPTASTKMGYTRKARNPCTVLNVSSGTVPEAGGGSAAASEHPPASLNQLILTVQSLAGETHHSARANHPLDPTGTLVSFGSTVHCLSTACFCCSLTVCVAVAPQSRKEKKTTNTNRGPDRISLVPSTSPDCLLPVCVFP